MKEKGYSYVSLDNLRDKKEASEDPRLFLSGLKKPAIIDEVQNAPGLLEVIKAIVDKARLDGKPDEGMCILTCSQTLFLRKAGLEPMAGRLAVVEMMALSQNELLGREEIPFSGDYPTAVERSVETGFDQSSVFEKIVRGNYPALYSRSRLSSTEFYKN